MSTFWHEHWTAAAPQCNPRALWCPYHPPPLFSHLACSIRTWRGFCLSPIIEGELGSWLIKADGILLELPWSLPSQVWIEWLQHREVLFWLSVHVALPMVASHLYSCVTRMMISAQLLTPRCPPTVLPGRQGTVAQHVLNDRPGFTLDVQSHLLIGGELVCFCLLLYPECSFFDR